MKKIISLFVLTGLIAGCTTVNHIRVKHKRQNQHGVLRLAQRQVP